MIFAACVSLRWIGCPSCKYNRAALPATLVHRLMPQHARSDDGVHRHKEMQQYFPTLVAQQLKYRVNLCTTTSEFYRYDNS